MVILNLVYPEHSDLKFEISKFPDGQQNIKLLSTKFDIYTDVTIKSRLNSWGDLEIITAAVADLRCLGVERIHLYVPYILGARSDRQFEAGGNNYLRDVICPAINLLNFKTVTCIDPHSDVLEACIKGFRKESNLDLVEFALEDIYNNNGWNGKWQGNCILVSPDAGASKKIYKLAEQIGYKGDIITCSKDRDWYGRLTRTVVPLNAGEHLNKDFIIIDDICDGGATFINIAKELEEIRTQYSKQKIYLIVTHGIFSKGTTELSHYFDGIYTTNSYKDINVLDGLLVKQYNIFE